MSVETKLDSKEIFYGKVLHVTEDKVQLENGHETTREIIHHNGAAAIIAFDEDDRLLLVRQFRYAIGEELLELPGVGRKTANLLLGDLYKQPGSVVCDTHCIRICGRLGLSQGKEPEKVERQLRQILPPEESSDFCHRIVLFGREVCTARSPKCGECPLAPLCKEMNG